MIITTGRRQMLLLLLLLLIPAAAEQIPVLAGTPSTLIVRGQTVTLTSDQLFAVRHLRVDGDRTICSSGYRCQFSGVCEQDAALQIDNRASGVISVTVEKEDSPCLFWKVVGIVIGLGSLCGVLWILGCIGYEVMYKPAWSPTSATEPAPLPV